MSGKFKEYCPICDNNGGVHGKCGGCGRPAWSKLHLGGVYRETAGTPEDVVHSADVVLSIHGDPWNATAYPNTDRDVQLLLATGIIKKGWCPKGAKGFRIFGVLGRDDDDWPPAIWGFNDCRDGIEVKAWRELNE